MSHNLTWQSVGYFPAAPTPTPAERYFVWWHGNPGDPVAPVIMTFESAITIEYPHTLTFHPEKGFETRELAEQWGRNRAHQERYPVTHYAIGACKDAKHWCQLKRLE